MTQTVAGFLLAQLAREGVEAAFGIPGGSATPLFDAVARQSAIRLVPARHEAGAAFMAGGYARLSGRPGLCLLTTGPGATNALTAVCAARADGVPLVVLTAQAALASAARGPLQDSTWDGIDTVAMYAPACKLSAAVQDPRTAGAVLRQALRAAMTGRRGPVHLSVPTDVSAAACPDEPMWPHEYRVASRGVDRSAVRAAAKVLAEARHPAILAGSGTVRSEAEPELLELAELLEAPVATTPKAKGAFPETHPLSLRVFGMAGSPWSEDFLLEGSCDAVFVIGSSLHEVSTLGWDRRLRPAQGSLLHLDIEPATIGRNYPADVGLVGDAKATLRELLVELRPLVGHGPRVGQAELVSWKRSRPAVLHAAKESSDEVPLKPQRVARELDEAIPGDAVIVLDVGSHALWALHHMTAGEGRSFVHNWGQFASMGFCASAIGAKIARPERPVVAVVGDGGFAMTGMEVSTAVSCGVPVVWIVFNDARLGTVYHGQRLQYGLASGSEFARFDAAGVAEALGARAFRVSEPGGVARAVEEALSCGGPAVVDVRVDADEPPPILSRVMALRAAGALAEVA